MFYDEVTWRVRYTVMWGWIGDHEDDGRSGATAAVRSIIHLIGAADLLVDVGAAGKGAARHLASFMLRVIIRSANLAAYVKNFKLAAVRL